MTDTVSVSASARVSQHFLVIDCVHCLSSVYIPLSTVSQLPVFQCPHYHSVQSAVSQLPVSQLFLLQCPQYPPSPVAARPRGAVFVRAVHIVSNLCQHCVHIVFLPVSRNSCFTQPMSVQCPPAVSLTLASVRPPGTSKLSLFNPCQGLAMVLEIGLRSLRLPSVFSTVVKLQYHITVVIFLANTILGD